MIDVPTIDELARRLTALGALKPEQWDEFKRLELTAIASERGEDALLLYGRLPHTDPAKQAMEEGLVDLRRWGHERVARLPTPLKPKLVFISGAPGSGKSSMMKQLEGLYPDMLLATADDFKMRFKEKLPGFLKDTPEPARNHLARSVYIHRLTSLPSWEMVDEALEAKKSMAVEMLGLGAAEDARTIQRALAKGYEVEVIHVGCSVEASLARATLRHFEQKSRGEEGRWIGLAAAAGKQKAILSSFAALKELLTGFPVTMRLMDNTDFQMKEIWNNEEALPPPIDRFASWTSEPALWREGVNPTADLCALHQDEEGQWHVALVERSHEPFKGAKAFPGGFIKGKAPEGVFEWGPETAMEAALRRFSEETLSTPEISRVAALGKFDALERDPRNQPGRWVESWVFAAQIQSKMNLTGGDSARSATWFRVEEMLDQSSEMAFDHASLLVRALLSLDPGWGQESKNAQKLSDQTRAMISKVQGEFQAQKAVESLKSQTLKTEDKETVSLQARKIKM